MNLQNEIAYRQSLFEQKVRKGQARNCWEWIGASSRGAGTFGLGELGVKSAHVAAWFLYRDPSYNVNLPHIFYHLCGNKGCVNPRHLAIIGSDGLINPQEIALFLADYYPSARKHLMAAADALPASIGRDEPASQSRDELPEVSLETSGHFQRLVAWYSDQLDGEWEQLRGIDIRTYAAPGWAVKIDLRGTELEDKPFASVNNGTEGAPTGWLFCEVFENTFKAWGDINKLPVALGVFLAWAHQ